MASPVIYNPKVLALIASLSTTPDTTIYTAPSGGVTRAVRVTSVLVCNKTAAACLFTLNHKRSATLYKMCNTVSIPADGTPYDVPMGDQKFLDPGDLLTGNASVASALDVTISGIEMTD